MATMPTRAENLQEIVSNILKQVDFFYIFLDNFEFVPNFMSRESKIIIRRSQEEGNLHAAGRLLELKTFKNPSVAVVVDDDIKYPENYVSTMVEHLAVTHGNAIVGVLGRSFQSPYRSYISDVVEHPFSEGLAISTVVDEVGVGTCAFLTEVMDVDVRSWTHVDANDIQLAIEGEKRGLRRICVQRPNGWLQPYSLNQPDSLSLRVFTDHSRHSALMQSLISMRKAISTSSALTERHRSKRTDFAYLPFIAF